MVRLIKKEHGNYTNTDNQLVRDANLSWKARGIFNYLWSQANEWQFYVNEIAKHSKKDGESALQSGLRELEKLGYLKRVNRQTKSGKFDGLEWILDDTAGLNRQAENTVDGKIEKNTSKISGYPSTEKTGGREDRQADNRPLRNNNNKKYQFKELTSINGSARADQSKTRMQKNNSNKTDSNLCKEVISYLNEKLGTKYKPSSAINKRLIDARAKEGYSLDDFKQVIDNKCATWAHDPKMSKYLRPQTLFGTKFESYLNEKVPNMPTHTDFKKAMLTDDTVENIPDDELPF